MIEVLERSRENHQHHLRVVSTAVVPYTLPVIVQIVQSKGFNKGKMGMAVYSDPYLEQFPMVKGKGKGKTKHSNYMGHEMFWAGKSQGKSSKGLQVSRFVLLVRVVSMLMAWSSIPLS